MNSQLVLVSGKPSRFDLIPIQREGDQRCVYGMDSGIAYLQTHDVGSMREDLSE